MPGRHGSPGGSGRADIRHEAVEFLTQPRAFGRERSCRAQHILRCRPGFRGAAIDPHDVGGSLLRALGDVLNAARDLTSEATTAKPRPASPARAASMVAFNANKLVCSAIAVISLTTSPISCAARDNLPIRPSVCWA